MGKKGRRGNGQGYVVKVAPGNYKAIVTIGYRDDDYKHPIKRTKGGFRTKADAVAYLPYLKANTHEAQEKITLRTAYERWLPTIADKSRSTIDCYKAGFSLFAPCWYTPMEFQSIDELQRCIDESGKGKRTRENAKACLGLVYKWAIPRGFVPDRTNLAQYLKVGGGERTEKHAFTDEQLSTIRAAVGTVPFAAHIYCQCYLGFRPAEFLSLTVADYHKDSRAFIGGAKTEAGKNRIVTISPKIQPIVDEFITKAKGGFVFGLNGKRLTDKAYREGFYACLSALGIQAVDDHTLTPHCCRHTFATLMKRVQAPDKDKMRLIGHASPEQLRYYQDIDIDDLRKITDKI